MINLKNLDKWKHLVGGEMFTFLATNPRTVRLEINAPFETRLYISPLGGDEALFLATVHGLDVVQFISDGAFTLYGDGDFSLYSSEFETVAVEVLEPLIFTEIAERRARNPELEFMMKKMSENLERRIAATQNDFLAALERERQNNVDTRAPSQEPAVPEPVPAPVKPVAGPDAGGDGGAGNAPSPVVAA